MSESLFSPLWYRVADQHPHLRTDVRVQRQHYRDELWRLLVGAADGRQIRINDRAWQFIGRCDGRHSVQQVWDALLKQFRDDAPTQDEVVRLLAQLDGLGLLAYETTPDVRILARRRDERMQQRRGSVNPFALRIPLGDPSRLLDRLAGLPALLFNAPAFAIWLAVITAALAAAGSEWNELGMHARTYMGTPRDLVLAGICFPFIKTLHELAHALAVRRWGGRIQEAGFSLFVLVPAPYVDASAANAFRKRHQRTIVGLAGMMAELALASLAMLVWLNVQPGLVRDAAFVVMFIASVSTVVFNGNPLLSFDAYYVMCDALDMPTLASRIRAWWAHAMRQLILGGKVASSMQPARGERKWLIFYAPASFAYRLFVSALLVFWLGAHSVLLGTLAALLLLIFLIIKPSWSAARRTVADARAGGAPMRAGAVATAGLAMILLLLCVVPLPYHTVAGGVVWLPEQARMRPETEGFIATLPVRDGERVIAGQVLLTLDDPSLKGERDRLASQMERLPAGRAGRRR